MKIYTGGGDRGKTGLFSGERVSKADPRVEAYGDIDELSSTVGRVVTTLPAELSVISDELKRYQRLLFSIGALLATTPKTPEFDALRRITSEDIRFIEEAIDRMEEQLPPLLGFILPGGSAVSASIHVARTVCRRAERKAVHLVSEREDFDLKNELIFLNRLSDYLFVAARYCNRILGADEEPWQRGEKDG